jgi:hypothetical protein
LSFFDKFIYYNWNIQFERWEILALLVFRAFELACWQKPKVLKYAAGSMSCPEIWLQVKIELS